MPKREVLICAKCGAEITEDPMLGDRQGGIRHIVHGATTWRLALCAKCAQPLWDLYEPYIEQVLPGGTATGMEALKYLPRTDMDAPGQQPATPPTFSGEG